MFLLVVCLSVCTFVSTHIYSISLEHDASLQQEKICGIFSCGDHSHSFQPILITNSSLIPVPIVSPIPTVVAKL